MTKTKSYEVISGKTDFNGVMQKIGAVKVVKVNADGKTILDGHKCWKECKPVVQQTNEVNEVLAAANPVLLPAEPDAPVEPVLLPDAPVATPGLLD